jgi:hypothetical protein
LIDAYTHSTRKATRFQFIIDILDIWLPATNLGFVHFNDGVLGIFGYVYPSSMILNLILNPNEEPSRLSWPCKNNGKPLLASKADVLHVIPSDGMFLFNIVSQYNVLFSNVTVWVLDINECWLARNHRVLAVIMNSSEDVPQKPPLAPVGVVTGRTRLGLAPCPLDQYFANMLM